MPTYTAETRAEARELWLVERLSDREIAERLGVVRADTIRDWRRAEDWESLAASMKKLREREKDAELQERRAALNRRHDQIGDVLETLIARSIKTGAATTPAELRQVAAALSMIHRVRRTALGMDDAKAPVDEPKKPPRRVIFVTRVDPRDAKKADGGDAEDSAGEHRKTAAAP